MNAQFNYLYRDASNYKQGGEFIVQGWRDDAVERLKKTLDGDNFFIAHQVNVPQVFFDTCSEDDHCWHEFYSLEKTDQEANDEHERTIDELLAAFEKIARSEKGWQEYDRLDEFSVRSAI